MMKTSLRSLFWPFCSTWNIFLTSVLLTLSVFTASCEKKDPKPELRDLIYQDMLEQLAEAERISKDTEAKILDIKKSTADARPQTGMQKKADRQIHEMEKLREKLSQQMTYWKIRSFERLKHVRSIASKQTDAYKSDQHEWETYKAEKKLRIAKNAWDIKQRFKETGFDYNPVLLGEMPGEAPPKPKPAAEGGGH